MTRLAAYKDSTGMRAAAEQQYQRLAPRAKENVRHAADVVAPYAGTAKDKAVRYAGEARHRMAPKVSSAVGQAREALPPRVEHAVDTAAKRTRSTVRKTTGYAVPRVEHAVETARAAAEPVGHEAAARSAAAVAALRGQVSVAEIKRLTRRRARRARAGRLAKRLAVLGAVTGGGYAAWRWWSRQTNPDWLVEAPAATEMSRGGSGGNPSSLGTVDGAGIASDPEAQAKQAEAEDTRRRGKRGGEPPA